MIIGRNVLALFEIAVGYGLLCVWLPSVCLHAYVKDKPLTYRFLFYQVCANMYLILWGFVLAFCKCFNTLTLWLTLVVLPLGIKALLNKQAVVARFISIKETAQTILLGMYGRHALVRDIFHGLRRQGKKLYNKYIKGHVGELLGLCLICGIILCVFGQYHLTHDGYAYGDENVHFYWEKELLHGNPFPVGIYPHGMHFLAAALSGMFGFPLNKISLMIGLFNVCLLFCTLYLVLKETFSSKAAVLFGIAFFLLTNMYSSIVYWRYQATLPMEMGLIPYCIMFFALQHFIGSRDKRDWLLFLFSVSWCIHTHFYAAIAAVFSCVAFGVIFLIPMIRRKILHWFIIGGIIGGILGCAPFGVGFALGYPFEQSMGWAINVIEQGAKQDSVSTLQKSEDTGDASKIDIKNISIRELLDDAFDVVTSPTARKLLLGLDALLLGAGLIGAINKKERMRCLMMAFLGLAWLISLGVSTGIISLIEKERFAVFFGFMAVPLFVLPAQLLYTLAVWLRTKPQIAETGLAAAALAFFFFMARDGYVKTDFTVETGIISEGDMKTCQRLMEEYPKETWTIVSTTYDLNLIRYYGYHYEIIDLLTKLDAGNGSLHIPLNDDRIYAPTKDIFVVVETQIDQYDSRNIRRDSHIGADPLVNHGKPTPELALTPLPSSTSLLNNATIYAYPWRSVVMSKLYYWMEKVKEAYPNEVSVFYRDDLVTVYHISQDEYFPLDLMLDYQSDLR